MEKERWIKNTLTVYSQIMKKLDPAFKVPGGGTALRTVSNFLDLMEKRFGCITQDRLVDYCICNLYAFRNVPKWNIKSIFGEAGLNRLADAKRGTKYYENLWVQDLGLCRSDLITLISDRREHPMAKYIYMESEESTKLRMINTEMGFMACQLSTLGWSPISDACKMCEFTSDCKKITSEKYPELYRIRAEYGAKS